MRKFWKFLKISDIDWEDWRWQLKSSLRNSNNIKDYFPNMESSNIESFSKYCQKFNFTITPYTLSLIEMDENHNPQQKDPIWEQFRFLSDEEIGGDFSYNGYNINWEVPGEFPTPIIQHKYPDRAIIRIIDKCFGYCNYCYLTGRVLDRNKKKANFNSKKVWLDTISYLKNNQHIRDVLISGGEPLLLDNDRIEKIFYDLRQLQNIKSIRLNSRFVTFIPYRLDEDLIKIFKKYHLTVLEIHIAHPREINEIFDKTIEKFDDYGYRPIIAWRAPLLKGVNDSCEILEELFLKLYTRRILPYYIFHYAPYSLGRRRLGVSIKRGGRDFIQTQTHYSWSCISPLYFISP